MNDRFPASRFTFDWLRLGRFAWLVCTAAALMLFLAGVPLQVQELSRGVLGALIRNTPQGREIMVVFPGQAADRAGLQPGDIILIEGEVSPGGNANLRVEDLDGYQRTVIIHFAVPPLPFGLPARFFAWGAALLDIAFVLGHILIAALLLWRAPQRGFALLIAFFLVIFSIRIPSEYGLVFNRDPSLRWVQSILSVLAYTLVPLILALFPNGRWFPRRAWLYPLVSLVYGAAVYLGLGRQANLTWVDAGLVGLGVVFQLVRYARSSSGPERQQTKWALYGITAAFVGYYALTLTYGLTPIPEMARLIRVNPGISYLYSLLGRLLYVPLLLIPLALAISILHYRLWDVDLVIRRTLSYGAVTGVLALVYLGSVVALQRMLLMVVGGAPQVAVALSTLAAAALFNPVRRRIQAAVDGRFYRRRYDSAQVLTRFSTAVRDEMDPDRLTEELLRVVDDTLHPRGMVLWLGSAREAAGEDGNGLGPGREMV